MLSTASSAPAECAICASAPMSAIESSGLVGVSTQISRAAVRGRSGADRAGVGDRHGVVGHAPAGQHLVEQPVRAAVGVMRDQHVVARAENGPDQAVLGGHPGRERQRPHAALQRGQALLERSPGRVRRARVLVALHPAAGPGGRGPVLSRTARTAAQAADAVLLVGGHLIDRRHDRTGQRIRFLTGVYCERLESVPVLDLSHARCPSRAVWPTSLTGQVHEHILPSDHSRWLPINENHRGSRLLERGDRGADGFA